MRDGGYVMSKVAFLGDIPMAGKIIFVLVVSFILFFFCRGVNDLINKSDWFSHRVGIPPIGNGVNLVVKRNGKREKSINRVLEEDGEKKIKNTRRKG